MKTISTVADLQGLSDDWRRQGFRIGLVPTMGYLHEGHLALMRKAVACCDRVIASLFVNPMQFGPGEDLAAYPRDFERDFQLAQGTGVDVLFAPGPEQMYGPDFQTRVQVERLSQGLCGACRPGHFDGVATVVTKLFLAAKPHVAVFGQKDFQQLAVIRQLVEDLNFDIEIIGHPIVRESDGLAMSSRNTYLTGQERKAAVSLSRSLDAARSRCRSTKKALPAAEIEGLVRSRIETNPECRVEYATVVDRTTLLPKTVVDRDSMLILAVKINDRVRLIDNAPLYDEDASA